MKKTGIFIYWRNCPLLLFIICVLIIITSSILNTHSDSYASDLDKKLCKCIVVRFDDIDNGYLEKVQIALLDYFSSHNQKISLALIMNHIYDDGELFQKISEGNKKGLFELGIHGWDHVDYTNMSEYNQRQSLLEANQKMFDLFGNKSRIFVPPFNLFNEDTKSAMRTSGLDILSSAIYYDQPDVLRSVDSYMSSKHKILSLPEMTDFSIYYNGKWVKVPLRFILADIDFQINTYGYSVLMIHPHNFAIEKNGTLVDILDIKKLKSLESLLNMIKLKNIRTLTFSEVLAFN